MSSGCTQTCQFYCDNGSDCDDGNDCDGVESCQLVTGGGGKNCQPGTPLGVGDMCEPTPRSICNVSGSCVQSLCGDSFIDRPNKGGTEECDAGAQNGVPLSGCTAGCLFQCHTAADCPDTEPCNGTLSCSAVSGGQTCTNGTIPPTGSVCGSSPRKICKSQACSASTCGDQFLDNQNGGTEQCEPPGPTCTSGTCQNQCDLSGTWGMRMAVTVSWPGTPVLETGSGTVRAWARVVRTQSSSTAIVDSGKPCGIEVPDFRGTALAGSELYGILFPNSLFDNANSIQPSTVPGTLTSSQVGASMTTPAFATLIGLTMAAPVTDPWPLPASITQRDDELDGQPGVTTNAKTGGTYFLPPIDPFKVFRADRLFLAVRQVVSLSGTLSDCSTMSGTAAFSKQDVAVLGCHVAGTGTPGVLCDTIQRDFLHNNSPVFTMPASGTFSMKKLAAAATCANVRTELP